MKKAKKLLSLFLAVMMLYSGMSVGFGGIASFAAAGDSVTVAGASSVTYNKVDDVIICVPETIYMSPTTGASVSGQYFVNNIVDSSGKVTLATDRADTTGQISIYAPGATAFSLDVTAAVGGIGEPVIGGSSTDANNSYEGTTWKFSDFGNASDYASFDGLQLFVNGTGVSMGSMASIKWAVTLTYSTGTVTYYVYSTLYTPHLSVGAVSESRRSGTYNNEISSWISGINGLAGGYSSLTSGTGDKTTTGYFKYDPLISGLQGGSSESSDDYVQSSSTWLYVEGKAPSGADWTRAVSYLGSLTIDSSRYTNTNQIPNLTIGSDALRVNSSKKDSLGKYYAWYVLGDSSTSIGSGEEDTPSGWTEFVNKSEPQATSRNTIIPAFAVSSINGKYIHTASQGYCTYLSNKNYANACASVLCTTVDKSELRKLVLQCGSLNSANYTGECWGYFIQAYETAAYVLGNPCASADDITNAINRLKTNISGGTDTALSATVPGLQIDVAFNGNGGSVSAASQRVTIGTNTSVSVTPSTATRAGYTFKGWATSASATSGSTANPLSVSLYSRNLYATWSANSYKLIFDNLFDFSKFAIGTGSLTVDERTDTGFTVTSTSGTDANTGFSYAIPVEAGKTYVLSADVSIEQADGDTKGFDIYINTLDANQAGEGTATVDTSNGAHKEGNVYISLTGQKVNTPGAYIRFTAGASTAYIKIRFDANTAGNKLTVNNIRLYEEGKVADGVSYHASKEVTYDSTYGTLPTPTRPGYVFAGWYGADGTTGYWANDKVVITSDTTVYSKWNPNTYTVTFEKNIGDGTSIQTNYTPEDSVTVPTITKTGYTLTGWNVTTADGNWSGTYNAGDVLTGMYGSAVLQAQWDIGNYTITFDENGGNAVSDINYTINDTVTIPSTSKTGYTFAGWKVTSGSTGNWTASTYNAGNLSAMYGDVTLTAQWTAIPYTITFVDWDNTVLQQSNFDYDSMPTPPANPTRADDNGYTYTFAGWNPEVDKVTGEATYTATYTATLIPYTITLDAGDGSVSSSSVGYNYESTSVNLPDAQKTGYTFTGWTVKESVGSWTAGATADGTLSNAYGNVTLVANYTPNQYTLTLDVNDANYIGTGELNDYSEFTVTYNSNVYFANGSETSFPADSALERNGYTFAGWYTVPTGGTDADKFDPAANYTTESDLTIYAYWTPIEYTLTLNNYNGSSYEANKTYEMTYTIESDLQLPCPDRTGYVFANWAAGLRVEGSWSRNAKYTDCNMGTGNYGSVTLTLNYTAKNYTITWVNEDGTVLATDSVAYDTVPSYTGSTPTKEADSQYSYTFKGWTPEVVAVTGDATYTATYTQSDRTYTIKFVDEDGTVLDTQTLKYGDIPTAPADPSKDATEQYTYTFAGWDNEVVAVTGDATYTATYTGVLRSYTITWIVDGKTTTEQVEYGKTPSFSGSTDKAADAQYTYTFTGWYPAITIVTGEATYTAQYTNTINTYTVIWKNADGTTLETDEDVPYGATPSYDGETPTKAADAQFTYTFDKWTPDVDTVTGNVTYTATYSTTVNDYTITFVDEDGTVLDEQTVKYGDTPVYGGETPVKAATAEWTYTFAGWTPTITSVIGDATYTVVYTGVKNEYTITFVDEDGTELQSGKVPYGTVPTAPANPTKESTAQYKYTFAGWTPEVIAVTGEATYTATYTSTIRTYTVTWYNYDGSVLETDSNVEYGKTPSFDGATPEKPQADGKIYAFSGWSVSADGEVLNALPTVDGEMKFYAIFVSGDAKFDVKWTDANGNVIETDTEVAYGTEPSYDGETPTKAADAQYTYTFIGWNTVENSDTALDLKAVKVTSATTFYPAYSKTVNKYTITFVNEDGTVLQSSEVEYGDTPSYTGATPEKTATAQYTYTHSGWTPAVTSVTGDATYTATYDSTVNKYTIKFVNDNGDVLQSSEVEYGTVPSYTGATPEKAATAQYTYTFADWDNAIVAVTGEATYTATYDSTVNKYTIKFVNEDGTVLQSSEVAYGDTPVYDGETPEKAATAQYTYTFADWDNAIVAVTGEATYTATYNSTVNKYTITFVNEDGTVLQSSEVAYGDTPSYTGATPEKAATAQYTYTHSGWTPAIVSVTGEATYTATYTATVNKYTITWITGAGTYTGEWEYGSMPDPETDNVDTSKASTVSTDYTFEGWDDAIAEVTGDATYTAQYDETTRKYNITWIVDGNSTTVQVEYGTVPEFEGTPVKASTVQYDYTFTSWDVTPVAVTGEATYTAIFTETVRKYTITWIIGDAQTTTTVAYGDTPVFDGTPTLAPTAEREYTFTNWSPEITAVTGAKTYTAQFSEKLRSYKVTYVVNGEVFEEQTVEFSSNFSHPEIPAVDGYDAYWKLDYMTMPAQDITVNAVYTPKKYTVTWIADDKTVYTEDVAFGSAIPSKTVPEKIGHTGVWNNIPATMPAEAITITASYTANVYSVVWSFIGGSDSTTATYGVDFEITFDYYRLPIDVRITVNGELLEEGYTYENGTLFISGAYITGYISISEKAAEGYQNVVVSAANASLTNTNAVVGEGEAFHTQIIPNEGYLLPESIVVCVDGIELYEGFSYDPSSGKITVNAEVMYGELSIRFDCPVNPNYKPNGSGDCGCNCHSDSAFVRFFFSIATFFRQIFGMSQYRYCDCGNAHW